MLWILYGDPDCSDGNCPTVYGDTSTTDSLIVQGYQLTDEQVAGLGELPPGETAIAVPRALIVGAYEQLKAQGVL